MAEWLVEAGVGETRAALVEDGRVVEARIERDDGALKVGQVGDAIVGPFLAATVRTRLTLDGHEALLAGRAGGAEGTRLRVAVVREAIPEPGRLKPARVALAPPGAASCPATSLIERLREGDVPVRLVPAHGPDLLEAAGWGEVIEAARTGAWAFEGGLLLLALTPAMTVIDVDGSLSPAALALAGAEAAARLVRLLDIGGSIGIDLPSAGSKTARRAAAAALDRLVPRPFERTAVNGFGFVQLVRPRPRASLAETVQADAATTATLALLRHAERDRRRGAVVLAAHPNVVRVLEAQPDWMAALARRRGAPAGLRADARLAISGGHVQPAPSLA